VVDDMLKTMVMTIALLVTGAACGQSIDQLAHSQRLQAAAARIVKEHPEAALALLAHATAALNETAKPTGVEVQLESDCATDFSGDYDPCRVLGDEDAKGWKDAERLTAAAAPRIDYSDVILGPKVKATINNDDFYSNFAERLQVAMPVADVDGGWHLGMGCKTSSCGAEEAAWVVDDTGAHGGFIIMNTKSNGDHHFRFLSNDKKLPAPLVGWAVQRGATQGQIVAMVSELTPAK
jgi:hypothetical protein